MVDKEYIEKNVGLIFEVEKRNIETGIIFHYVEDYMESSRTKNMDFWTSAPLRDLELKPSDKFRLEWDTYTDLKKLYNKVNVLPRGRDAFLSIIEKKLSNLGAVYAPIFTNDQYARGQQVEIHSKASLAFYFLLEIGNSDSIIRALRIKMNSCVYLDKHTDSDSGESLDFEVYTCTPDIAGLFTDVLVFMHLEPEYFDDPLLDLLLEIVQYNFNGFNGQLLIRREFEDKIIYLKYGRLRKELEPSNEEINIHKEQVIGIISKYGFPTDMEKFLLEIDELPESNLQSINSGMIGKLRSFFEALVKSIAEKIYNLTGEEYPHIQGKQEMGNKREYIKKWLVLSDKDDKLLTAYVDILHKEGGHALISEKRHFVMSKNIGIEIAYFLLSAYEENFEKNK